MDEMNKESHFDQLPSSSSFLSSNGLGFLEENDVNNFHCNQLTNPELAFNLETTLNDASYTGYSRYATPSFSRSTSSVSRCDLETAIDSMQLNEIRQSKHLTPSLKKCPSDSLINDVLQEEQDRRDSDRLQGTKMTLQNNFRKVKSAHAGAPSNVFTCDFNTATVRNCVNTNTSKLWRSSSQSEEKASSLRDRKSSSASQHNLSEQDLNQLDIKDLYFYNNGVDQISDSNLPSKKRKTEPEFRPQEAIAHSIQESSSGLDLKFQNSEAASEIVINDDISIIEPKRSDAHMTKNNINNGFASTAPTLFTSFPNSPDMAQLVSPAPNSPVKLNLIKLPTPNFNNQPIPAIMDINRYNNVMTTTISSKRSIQQVHAKEGSFQFCPLVLDETINMSYEQIKKASDLCVVEKAYLKNRYHCNFQNCKNNDSKGWFTKARVQTHAMECHYNIQYRCPVGGCGKLCSRVDNLSSHIKYNIKQKNHQIKIRKQHDSDRGPVYLVERI